MARHQQIEVDLCLAIDRAMETGLKSVQQVAKYRGSDDCKALWSAIKTAETVVGVRAEYVYTGGECIAFVRL
jgi:hypothetical protein